MLKYFDIHSHLDYSDYGDDFSEIIFRMNESGVGTITVGTDLESARRAVLLADQNENIWACIGIHPADNHAEIWNESEYEKLVSHPKVVAIGECGLDFFRMEGDAEENKKRQVELFKKQIEFAIKHDKTLMIHCRDAYNETYEILADYKNHFPSLRIHFHFFAGNMEMTKKLLDLDATFSFTGVITFANSYDEVIKFLPIDKIMSETDAPFVAPVPYRGKRNEPAYVLEVIKKLAELRGISFDEMAQILAENAIKRFGLLRKI